MYVKMFLSATNIGFYIFERGLTSFEAYQAGVVHYDESHGRNFGLQVEMKTGASFFVKQCKSNDLENRRTFEKEAIFYDFMSNHPSHLTPSIPTFYDYDARYAILVLELVLKAQNLYKIASISEQIIRQVAQVLAALHTFKKKELLPFSDHVPTLLTLHDTHTQRWLLSKNNTNHQALLKMLFSRKVLLEGLGHLAKNWRSERLCHGDLKFENILISTSQGLRLIDWEEAGWGDSLWDAAGVIQSLISKELMESPQLIFSPFVASEPLKSPNIRQNSASFWSTYTSLMDDTFAEEQVIGYVGARMIGRLFEYSSATDISARAREMIPLAEKMITEPHKYTYLLKNNE
ncbi:aminoglycoside phosphotransferase family protein [Runella sp. MFBS21]|uniref:aminoglycoside phosphotransferase family protein n=1 Tax=Runella sp. MFBS21 TaxID=3034018 RepID=UPI0023F6DBE1|nr:aminoglycoside phosphotransferase family protein [Runella sp. MFBS21]MDF7818557.1 aminoglycoside phosphotransferase family protein [Runella sp. MFBS21]